jgi:prepilin-type N-terminal cleavage/methylation domain-containing protein
MKTYLARTAKTAARSGLTLVELLVVLVILAIVTMIAVQSTESLIDQSRYDATQRTLQNIQDAIIGPANQRAPDGSLLITGFVTDMGRLPLCPPTGFDLLSELWDPRAVAANGGTTFSVQSVPTMNVYAGTPPPMILLSSLWPPGLVPLPPTPPPPTSIATVTLACGWRGPYLQLPTGSGGRLFDGWGNPFQSLFQVPGSTVFPTTPVPGQTVNIVCSLGSDSQFDTSVPTNPYNQDQYVPQQLTVPPVAPLASFTDRGSGSFLVQVQTANTATTPATLGPPIPMGTTDIVSVVVFFPVNGKLTPTYLANPTPTAPIYQNCFPLLGPVGAPNPLPISGTFVSLPIGASALQAFQFDSTTGNIRKRSPVSYLMLPPGGVPTQTLTLQ